METEEVFYNLVFDKDKQGICNPREQKRVACF